jgi:hypothetical protein
VICVGDDTRSSSSQNGVVRLVRKTTRVGISIGVSVKMMRASACAIAKSINVWTIDARMTSACSR